MSAFVRDGEKFSRGAAGDSATAPHKNAAVAGKGRRFGFSRLLMPPGFVRIVRTVCA